MKTARQPIWIICGKYPALHTCTPVTQSKPNLDGKYAILHYLFLIICLALGYLKFSPYTISTKQ